MAQTRFVSDQEKMSRLFPQVRRSTMRSVWINGSLGFAAFSGMLAIFGPGHKPSELEIAESKCWEAATQTAVRAGYKRRSTEPGKEPYELKTMYLTLREKQIEDKCLEDAREAAMTPEEKQARDERVGLAIARMINRMDGK